jgi:plastocyanin
MRKFLAPLFAALIIAVTAVSCGGGNDSPSSPSPAPSPSPTPTPTPTPGGSTPTITITSAGVSPRSVTIAVGGRVNFVNNDTRPHDMSSNPHPEHTDCPAMNQAGFLQPGQSRETGNFTTARTCGFHDHNRDTDTTLQGSIVIQ